MFIYLEGPDGTGKTTLARELCRIRPAAVYLHDTYRGPRQFLYTIGLLRRAHRHLMRGRPVVLDRSWIGDNIYSRIFRPGQQGDWVRWGHGLTDRLGAINVLAVPSERDRYLSDYEKLKTERVEKYAAMAEVYDAYAQLTFGIESDASAGDYIALLSRTGGLARLPQSMVYDRFSHQGANLAQTATSLWERADHRSMQAHLEIPSVTADNWSGRQLPDTVLLVGERPANPFSAWAVPFLMDQGSSRYLARALTLAGIRQDRLAMVNSREADDQSSWMLRIALRRNPRKVVALGQVALRTVRELAPTLNNVHLVPHPQWRRRFKFHDITEYAGMLKEACA